MAIPLFFQAAFACSCSGGANPCSAFRGKGNLIFIATAVDEIRVREKYGKPIQGSARRITLRVDEVFKGEVPQVIETSDDGFRCDNYPFKKGFQYLVYANSVLGGSRNIVPVGLCSGTGLVSSKTDDIGFLRRLKSGEKVSVLYGRVLSVKGKKDFEPLSGVKVQMYEDPKDVFDIRNGKRPARKFRTISGDDGSYQFLFPEKGTFRVKGVFGGELWSYSNRWARGIPVSGAPFCRKVDVYAFPNGTVSGRLLHPDGTPAAFQKLRIIPEDKKTEIWPFEHQADENGRFEIKGVANGKYRVSVQLSNYRRHKNDESYFSMSRFPLPSYFYGGSFFKEDATVIEIVDSKPVNGLQVYFPLKPKLETFSVKASIPEGIELNSVELRYQFEPYQNRGSKRVRLKYYGVGEVKFFRSLRYRVWVVGSTVGSRRFRSDFQIVEGNSEEKGLRFVLKEF